MIGVDRTLTAEARRLARPNTYRRKAQWRAYGSALRHLQSRSCHLRNAVGALPFNEGHGHLTAMAHITKAVPLPSLLHLNFATYRRFSAARIGKRSERALQTMQEFSEAYYDALMRISPNNGKRSIG